MSEALSRDTKVWRYMSFAKFVSMLQTHTLFFPRPFKFVDKWEGLFPPSFYKEIVHWGKEHCVSAHERISELSSQNDTHMYGHFVSCWHINENESDAMWRLYGLSPEGVAIQSTVGNFNDCLHPDRVGAVIYYDPMSHKRKEGLFGPHPLQYKRNHFEFEREFRAWFDDPDTIARIRKGEAIVQSELSPGKAYPIEDLPKFIERIVVAPGAGKWFSKAIEGVCESLNRRYLITKIIPSSTDRAYQDMIKQIDS